MVVQTATGPCVWVKTSGYEPGGRLPLYSSSCAENSTAHPNPDVYVTEGGKGNLTTGGKPSVFGTVDHAGEWLMSQEKESSCSFRNSSQPGCWVEVGWEIGYSESACGTNYGTVTSRSTPAVYVEMYDDSSSPCLTGSWGNAPANASYDARYTEKLSDGRYRYDVYFEVPGSGNIQNLAWGEYNVPQTLEVAAAEVADDPNVTPNYCPVLGQATNNLWNVDGEPSSLSTFASYMNLYYNGGWQNWTTLIAPTHAMLWPPDGPDTYGAGSSTNPYTYGQISNMLAGNYTEWETTGPVGP